MTTSANEAVVGAADGAQPAGRVARTVEAVAYGLVVALLGWLVTRLTRNNLRWFDGGHDFLAYHLPFGIRIFEPDLMRLSPHLEELYLGSPQLFSWVMGLVWKLHPLLPLNALHMLGLAAWLAALPIVALVVGRQFVVFALLSLAAPLVLIHTMSGYVDLPANVFILLLLVSLFALQTGAARPWAWASLGILALGVMGASKYTVMPLAWLGSLMFAVVVHRSRALSGRTRWLLIVLGLLAAASWGLRNLWLHGNPVYPLKPPVIGHLVPYTWTLPDSAENWPADLLGRPQPLVTLASLFELSVPEQVGPRPRYQVDQWGNGPGTAGYRMGGFGWPVVAVGAVGLAWGLWRRRLKARELAPFLVLATTTLFLPQSHELRYSLYIPLMLGFLVAVVVQRADRGWERVVVLAACLAVASWSVVNSPVYLDKRTRSLDQLARKEGIDLKALPSAAVYCGRRVGAKLIFLTGPTLRESRAAWSGPGRPCPVDGHEVVGTYNW